MILCIDCTLRKDHIEKINRYGMITEKIVPCEEYKTSKQQLTEISGTIVGCSNGVDKQVLER